MVQKLKYLIMDITCENCKLFNELLDINNCNGNVVATTHKDDMGCYKIQKNYKNNIYE